jgi:hypothetical protein
VIGGAGRAERPNTLARIALAVPTGSQRIFFSSSPIMR